MAGATPPSRVYGGGAGSVHPSRPNMAPTIKRRMDSGGGVATKAVHPGARP